MAGGIDSEPWVVQGVGVVVAGGIDSEPIGSVGCGYRQDWIGGHRVARAVAGNEREKRRPKPKRKIIRKKIKSLGLGLGWCSGLFLS